MIKCWMTETSSRGFFDVPYFSIWILLSTTSLRETALVAAFESYKFCIYTKKMLIHLKLMRTGLGIYFSLTKSTLYQRIGVYFVDLIIVVIVEVMRVTCAVCCSSQHI